MGFVDPGLLGGLRGRGAAGEPFVALVGWLVADAVRDLAPSRRAHTRLDVVRVVSASTLVVFAIGVALWHARHPGDESGEAIIFAMASGVSGAMIATGAQVATGLAERGA
ncbi:MAG TPA: hypothetical protein VFC06_02510 [Demequina sp.]|nr:hypothetical protein [Demequina sp.]